MNDALWTDETTRKAVFQWIEGRDASEIAAELGTTPEDVIRQVAQAAQTLGAKPEAPAAPKTEPAAPKLVPAAAKAAPAAAKAAPTAAKVAPTAPKAVAAAPKTAALKTAAPAAPAPSPASPPAETAAKPRILPRTEPAAQRETARGETPCRIAPAAVRPAAPAVPSPAAILPTAARRPAPGALSVPAPAALAVPAPAASHAPAAAASHAPAAAASPALPAPGARRPLVAADGGEGVPFMKAGLLDCVFPLWSDHEGGSIETKRVCGCRVVTGKRWCPQHYAVVFEPLRKPQRAA
ncbi:hypothetical protein [Methylobacterium durans]|uniref:GcrA cell cycle regulator n=1 Tax=Methylobacterium durans TaxID=2202825 RepID=A0A2U8WCT0_9HYPH|nr:hypothetical protein [Methylobacterium durans]AWN43250.1 hypothetical protein DK389_25535 [Methylobacterium durans]